MVTIRVIRCDNCGKQQERNATWPNGWVMASGTQGDDDFSFECCGPECTIAALTNWYLTRRQA